MGNRYYSKGKNGWSWSLTPHPAKLRRPECTSPLPCTPLCHCAYGQHLYLIRCPTIHEESTWFANCSNNQFTIVSLWVFMYVRVKHVKVSAVKNKYYIKNTAADVTHFTISLKRLLTCPALTAMKISRRKVEKNRTHILYLCTFSLIVRVSLLVMWCTNSLTFNNCTICPQYIYGVCVYLNSDLCHLKHKLVGFYYCDEKCLQRGTDWVFKYSGLRFVFKRLNRRNAIRVLKFNNYFTQISPIVLRGTQQQAFWGSIPCRFVGWHCSFGKACCLHLQDRSNKVLGGFEPNVDVITYFNHEDGGYQVTPQRRRHQTNSVSKPRRSPPAQYPPWQLVNQ